MCRNLLMLFMSFLSVSRVSENFFVWLGVVCCLCFGFCFCWALFFGLCLVWFLGVLLYTYG